MTFLYLLHLIILGAIISIPAWPMWMLRYGMFIPAMLSVIWILCGGCPISLNQPELKGKAFIHTLLEYPFPGIKESRSNDIVTALMVWITLLSGLRLINSKK